jgi:hypothetical protein
VSAAPSTDVRRLPDRTFIAVNISVRDPLMSTFARSRGGSIVGRIVEDQTGLRGCYALTLTDAKPSRRTGMATHIAGCRSRFRLPIDMGEV